MNQISKFCFLITLLFFCSCEKEIEPIDDKIIATEERVKKQQCFTTNKLEELENDCCRYLICADPNLLGQNFIQVNNDLEVPLSTETGCTEITLCGMNIVTIINYDIFENRNIGCSNTITCFDREACCESICFNFETISLSTLCTSFIFTLDGDPECFPNGIYMGTNGLGGPIRINDISSDQGTVELIGSNPSEWTFNYCMNDLYFDNLVQITIFERYCESEITFEFDPFKDQLYHRRCK